MDRTPRIFAFTALGLSGLPPTPASTHEGDGAADVGDAGFYGRLDVGDYPAPRVIYREPVVERGYTDAGHDPVYVRVPTAHRKHWNRECRRYNACGEPVYFVRDDWYNDVYAPQYRERHERRTDDRNDDQRDGREDNGNGDRDNNRGGRSN
jgi:hypothetical protein